MQPLKVKIYLKRPAAVSRLLTLDKLIAAVLFGRRQKNEKYSRDVLKEIFKEKDGVFAASIYFTETPVIYSKRQFTVSPSLSRNYYRMFLEKIPDMVWLGTSSGPMKHGLSEYTFFYTDYIYFYTFADKNKLYDALKKVRFIGKKSQFGHGNVRSFEIEEIKEDKSFLLNDWTPARPLPADWGIKTSKIALYNIDGPAWDRTGVAPCTIPPLSIKERTYPKPAEQNYALETVSATEFAIKYHKDAFKGNEKKVKKALKYMQENTEKKPCAACGAVKDKVFPFKSIKDFTGILTSSNYSDYKNFNFEISDCLCENCVIDLAVSFSTRTPTLITKTAIEKVDEIKALQEKYYDDEYIMLYYKSSGSSQKHILIGALPSISPDIKAVNKADHELDFIDADILTQAIEMVRENPNLKGINPKSGENLDERIEYNWLVDAAHASIIQSGNRDTVLKGG